MPGYEKLEPEFQEDFTAWKTNQTPQTTGKLLATLSPVINRGVKLYASDSNSPVLRGRARRITLEALSSYDPSRARLQTHIGNHLQGLRRVARNQGQILRVPERFAMESAHLAEAENGLTDLLGREPSTQELADHTGYSVKRIAHVRSYRPPMAEGSIVSRSESEEGGDFAPAVQQQRLTHVEAVYHDADPVNQKILEWTLGMHGTRRISNQQIAAKLRITPGAVSQRKAILQRKLDEAEGLF